jgi:3-oxoacyl-[acyl-carrier protein] reductase
LVTGASRRAGIGYAIARRLEADRLVLHGWGDSVEDVAAALREERPGVAVETVEADFADPEAPERVIDACGELDILVVNHTDDPRGGLGELAAADIDRALAVIVRASLLLVQAFYARHDGREGGRVILMTSGQHRGAMPGELPYIASKGALRQLTGSVAGHLMPRGITVNCVNPGPNDTGYADDALRSAVAAANPGRRWGTPTDTARLVAWLVSDEAGWVTGQVIASDGGWSARG